MVDTSDEKESAGPTNQTVEVSDSDSSQTPTRMQRQGSKGMLENKFPAHYGIDSPWFWEQAKFQSLLRTLDFGTTNAVLRLQKDLGSMFESSGASVLMGTHLKEILGSFDRVSTLSNVVASLSLPAIGNVSALRSIADSLPKMTLAIPEMRLPVYTWQASLADIAKTLGSIDLSSRYPLMSSAILEPHLSWGRFVEDTGMRLHRAKTQQEADALSGSLLLAQEQLVASTALTESIVIVPQDEDTSGPLVSLNALQLQRRELLKSRTAAPDASIDSLISLSPSAQIISQVLRILDLVEQCNEMCEFRNEKPVFKPTTRTMISVAKLPFVQARSRETFGGLIDLLYFVFYEGAGKDNLRYLSFVSNEDCRVIWALKHLRNTYLRHDPDHGDQGKIRAEWRKLRDDLEWMGISSLPRSAAEYQFLQLKLLQAAEELLKRLLMAITKYQPS